MGYPGGADVDYGTAQKLRSGEWHVDGDAIVRSPRQAPRIVEGGVMCYVGGSKNAYRCVCGCNIFNKLSNGHYGCNVCDREYEGS